MLDTRFPRPVGDLGNLSTWPVPVNIRVVRGIWPDKVVQSAAGLHAGRVGPAFASVVRALVREGASADRLATQASTSFMTRPSTCTPAHPYRG